MGIHRVCVCGGCTCELAAWKNGFTSTEREREFTCASIEARKREREKKKMR